MDADAAVPAWRPLGDERLHVLDLVGRGEQTAADAAARLEGLVARRFGVAVGWNVIAVFDPEMDAPFNDWSQRHVGQGFSWRRGGATVSFRTVDECVGAAVELRRYYEYVPDPACERIILVPFAVAAHGVVEVAGIDRGPRVRVGAGEYRLAFEASAAGDLSMQCRLTLYERGPDAPQVLRADHRLSPELPLLMEAEPAQRHFPGYRTRGSRTRSAGTRHRAQRV